MGQLAAFASVTLSLLHVKSLFYGLFSTAVVLTSASHALKPRKQKYAAAPIACVEDRKLAAARRKFRTDARETLREGYEKYKGLLLHNKIIYKHFISYLR